MNNLRQAQRHYDRRLPSDGRRRAEREFEAPEFAPPGAPMICSVKYIDLAEVAKQLKGGK